MNVMFVIIWLLFCILIAVAASKKGRSGIGWFLISALLSPLLGAIGLLLCGDKKHIEGAR